MKKFVSFLICICIFVNFYSCTTTQKKLEGRWEYEQSEIKVNYNDTSKAKAMKMEEFVTQLALRNTDLLIEKEGKFKTLKNNEVSEEGNYTLNGKILTFEYINGTEKDIEDMELMSISDTTMQLRNSSNMYIDYKKINK